MKSIYQDFKSRFYCYNTIIKLHDDTCIKHTLRRLTVEEPKLQSSSNEILKHPIIQGSTDTQR